VSVTSEKIDKRLSTRLDQLIQILEISFIFLFTFSLIALIDTTFSRLNLYSNIADIWLGDNGIGPLDGGNWEAIVRITFIFNFFLFGFSLTFGTWMRRTRDGWGWSKFGYVFSTNDYSFLSLIRRGILLGLIAMLIFYIGRMTAMSLSGGDPRYAFVYTTSDLTFYTSKQLYAEYYFGFVEMGIIWPVSAGFFFFAYNYTSLREKFPQGVANTLSTLFYVFYLQFFFLISEPDKITQYWNRLSNPAKYPVFWIMSIALLVILYINFSAFAETKSIILPFTMNFVLNVGTTILQAANTLYFTSINQGVVVLPTLLVVAILGWLVIGRKDFSTIYTGLRDLKDLGRLYPLRILGLLVIYVTLSFLLPGVINDLLYYSTTGKISLPRFAIPLLYSMNLILLISLAIAILTYEPTKVWDVLLISKGQGIPIASHIELFETDDVLISGFFTALSAVNEELSKDGGLSAIQRGERVILIEDGVLTRLIALVDRDKDALRSRIQKMHRKFESENIERLGADHILSEFDEANEFVEKVNEQEVTFEIPQQTKWIGTISLLISSLTIFLVGML